MKNIGMVIFYNILIVSIFVSLSIHIVDGRSPSSITCSTVEINAMPCLPFAEGDQTTVDPKCCTGVSNLAASATTNDDKKTACNCLADAFKKFPSVQDGPLKRIPTLCNVTVPFPLSKDLKCNNIADSRRPVGITCSTVEINAMPCLSFAEGDQTTVDPKCCTGLSNLAASATTTDDKKTACNCLADAFKKFPSVQDGPLKKIPALCNVIVPFPLSKDLKCNNIKEFTSAH